VPFNPYECETVIEFLDRKKSLNFCVLFFILMNCRCAVSSMLVALDMKDQLTKVRSMCDIQEISWKPFFKTEHLYFCF
jgi:hypothetical protein